MNRKTLPLLAALLLVPPLGGAPPAAGEKQVDLSVATKPWKGDLDGMLQRLQRVDFAAEKIGMETITYVSNIYKYYVACRLLLDLQEERKKELGAFEKSKGEGPN